VPGAIASSLFMIASRVASLVRSVACSRGDARWSPPPLDAMICCSKHTRSGARTMKLGLIPINIGIDDPARIVALSQVAESAGFESVWARHPKLRWSTR
jgi:hypothetical protein